MPRKNVTRSGPEKTHHGGNTDLCVAASIGFHEKVSTLLCKGAPPNAKNSTGKTALHLAAMHGFTSIVHTLLDYDASPFICDDSGHTPLDLALEGNQQEVVDLLCYTMNSSRIRDTYSWSGEQNRYPKVQYCNNSSLISAVRKRKAKFVREAVDAGSFLEEKDSEGNTAVCVAAKMGLEHIVPLVLDHGACVNVKNNFGRTHMAVMGGSKIIVEILLKSNASPYVRDRNGSTPLDLARVNNCKKIEEVLQNKLHTYMNAVNKYECAGFEKTCLHLTVHEQCLDTLGQAVRSNGCSLKKINLAPRRKAAEMILHPTEALQSQYSEEPVNSEEDFNRFRKIADMMKQARVIFVAQHRAKKRRFCQLQERSNYHVVNNDGVLLKKCLERKQSHRDRMRRRAGMMKHMSADQQKLQNTTRRKPENAWKRLNKIERRRFVNNTEKRFPQFESVLRVRENAKYTSLFPTSHVEEFPTLVHVKSGKKKQENSKEREVRVMPTSADDKYEDRVIMKVLIEDLLKAARERNNRKNYRKSLKKYKKLRKHTDNPVDANFLFPNVQTIRDKNLTDFDFCASCGGKNVPKQDPGVGIDQKLSKRKSIKNATKGKKRNENQPTSKQRWVPGFQSSVICHNLPLNGISLTDGNKFFAARHCIGATENKSSFDCFVNAEMVTIFNAVLTGRKHLVNKVIAAKVYLDAQDPDGNTALCLAAEKGLTTIVSLLLENGACPSTVNNIGRTALHLAALGGHTNVVEKLLSQGESPLVRDAFGASSLDLAEQGRHKKVIAILKKYLVNETERTSGKENGTEILENSVETEASNVNSKASQSLKSKNSSMLLQAAGQGNLKRMQFLIDDGVLPSLRNSKGLTALHVACINGHIECCKLLLNRGANVASEDVYGRSSLHLASSRGQIQCINILLKHGAKIEKGDKNGMNALHTAAINGHADCITYLVENGADVSSRDGRNRTALHIAAKSGQATCVSVLLKHKSLVSWKDRLYRTPLHRASYHGHLDCVLILLKHGSDFRRKDGFGETDVLKTAIGGHTDCMRALLDAGADIAARDKSYNTALHLAAIHCHEETVKFLLQAGANRAAKNKEKLTPLKVAGNDTVRSLLS
ncbi:Transient receptor potential channel pyrexia [Gryllus bimaculatus]|nr:Transient receptor potential channel pyrexia [Gryllus bimaculatus]